MTSSQPSEPMPATGITNLLLTGASGCGKTTVLERVAEHVGDLRLAGFLTLDFEQDGVPLPAVYLSDEMASEPAGPRRIDHCSSRRWFHG